MLNSELNKLEDSLRKIGNGKVVEVSKPHFDEVNNLKNFYQNNYQIVGPVKSESGYLISFIYKKNNGVKNA